MRIQTEIKIDSAHKLPNYIGKCSNLHGHSWKIIITIDCDIRDKNDFVVDFTKIKEVMSKYDHTYLNDFFENPTAENLAEAFAYEIRALGKVEGQVSASGNFKLNEANRFNSVTVKVYESEVAFAETTL